MLFNGIVLVNFLFDALISYLSKYLPFTMGPFHLTELENARERSVLHKLTAKLLIFVTNLTSNKSDNGYLSEIGEKLYRELESVGNP